MLQEDTLHLNPFPHYLLCVSEAVLSSENPTSEVTGVLDLVLIAELCRISPLLYAPFINRRSSATCGDGACPKRSKSLLELELELELVTPWAC